MGRVGTEPEASQPIRSQQDRARGGRTWLDSAWTGFGWIDCQEWGQRQNSDLASHLVMGTSENSEHEAIHS